MPLKKQAHLKRPPQNNQPKDMPPEFDPSAESEALEKLLSPRTALRPSQILSLQRAVGNKAVHQLLTNRSGATPPSPQTSSRGGQIQRIPINQQALANIYRTEGDYKRTLEMLNGVTVIDCSDIFFMKHTPKSSDAITLPHENPPVILFNNKSNPSHAVVASTLYHELHHAYDPDTPPKTDNSTAAVKQDFKNEAKTVQIEAERGIRLGGDTLKEVIRFGSVIEIAKGKFVVNQKFIQNIENGNYSNYAKVSRADRFSLANYTFNELTRYQPGSWNTRVRFEARGCNTQPGQDIFVVGSLPELGSWEPGKARPLAYNNGNWQGEIRLPLGASFEYKFIKKEGAGYQWDPRENRSYTLNQATPLALSDEWGK